MPSVRTEKFRIFLKLLRSVAFTHETTPFASTRYAVSVSVLTEGDGEDKDVSETAVYICRVYGLIWQATVLIVLSDFVLTAVNIIVCVCVCVGGGGVGV
jgi:hypothetical protein